MSLKKKLSGNTVAARLLAGVCLICLFLVTVFGWIEVQAQQGETANSNTASTPTPDALPSQTPVPVAVILSEKEQTEKRLQEIGKEVSDDVVTAKVQNDLSDFIQNLDKREQEIRRLLERNPSLDSLNRFDQEWQSFGHPLQSWMKALQAQATERKNQSDELQEFLQEWEQTRQSSENKTIAATIPTPTQENSNSNNQTNGNISVNSNVQSATLITPEPTVELPENLKEDIGLVIQNIKETQKKVSGELAEILKLQQKISETEKRVNGIIETIDKSRDAALSNLVVKDAPPIWSAESWRGNVGSEVGKNFDEKLSTLKDYLVRYKTTFVFYPVFAAILVLLFYWVRRKTHRYIEEEPKIRQAFVIFELPFVSAVVLALFVGPFLFPQAPELLSALMSFILVILIFFLIKRLVEKQHYAILIATVVLFILQDLKTLTVLVPLLYRVLFLTQMLGAIVFLIWLARSNHLVETAGIKGNHNRVIKKVSLFLIVPLAFAFFANAFGYISLGSVIGKAVIYSATLGLIIYALVKVVDSLLIFIFRTTPASGLMMVKNHRGLVRRKAFKVIKWFAIGVWVFLLLKLLYIINPIWSLSEKILFAELEFGTIKFSLSGVFLLILTIWASFLLSRFIRFALAEDVYPRVSLADGLPYAVSTILHYLILFLGFLAAIAAVGIDLSKFALLIGAFGVGLGFGLQNIIENFSSGLILLFERPVKVGDTIQFNDHLGNLQQIGLRASVVRTFDGADIIVPNGQLISQEVTNWTLSDARRRIDLDVGVEYGSSMEQVIELLENVGKNHPAIDGEPAPRAIFVSFGDNSLDFQLRVWTHIQDTWVVTKSELAVEIYKTLDQAGIGIPFPQQDLHLKTIDGELISHFKNSDNGKKK